MLCVRLRTFLDHHYSGIQVSDQHCSQPMWLLPQISEQGRGISEEGCLFEGACFGKGLGTIIVNLLWYSSKEQFLLQRMMCTFLVSVSSTAYSDAVCRVSASHGISCYCYSINNHFHEDAQPVLTEDLSKVIISVLGQVREEEI